MFFRGIARELRDSLSPGVLGVFPKISWDEQALPEVDIHLQTTDSAGIKQFLPIQM